LRRHLALDRLDLARSFDSAAVKLSIDTGHAHNAHCDQGRCRSTTSSSRRANGWPCASAGYRRFRRPPLGTGARHDQLGSVFAALAASPADPHLVLELRDRDDIPDAMAYLERNGLAC
jgi:sugar phosphate isomerase/epimerase